MSPCRMPLLALSLAGLVTFAAPASGEVPPFAVSLTGAVRTPLTITTGSFSGLLARTQVVRVSGAAGAYRGTFEVEGVALRELLEKAEVSKRTDDEFDRPLDLAVVVTGRDGRRAVFSWGEVFIGGDAGPLLVDQLRPFIPHHHEPTQGRRFAPGMRLGLEERARLDVSDCSSCHDGGKSVKLDVPRGLCLVPTGDATGRRFVEDVLSIEVRQAGFLAPCSSSSRRATATGRSTRAARSFSRVSPRTSSSSTPRTAGPSSASRAG